MNPLRQSINEYLALRRSLGFKLRDAEDCLRDFVEFAEERGIVRITTRVALDWAMTKPSARPERAAERLRASERSRVTMSEPIPPQKCHQPSCCRTAFAAASPTCIPMRTSRISWSERWICHRRMAYGRGPFTACSGFSA